MRPPVSASRLRFLSLATALATVTALSACSSDATRFEEQLTTATTLTANQQSIIERRGPAEQPYPGDAATTGSVQPVQPDTNRYNAAAASAPSIKRQPLSAVSSTGTTATVPAPTATRYAPSDDGSIVLSPRKAEKPKLRLVGVDRTSTGSVAKAEPEPTAAKPEQQPETVTASRPADGSKKGWTKTGGTWVTIGSGETLYNLSRRFGVPVRAIMSANGISNADSVAAGSKILIPTYNFSNTAAVSAPDNNPQTKAARSSRGLQGEVRNGKVALPKKRVAAAQVDTVTTGSVPEAAKPQAKSVKRAPAPEPVVIADKATEAVKTAAKTSAGTFRWPAQGRIIKKFGDRKRNGANDGIDISLPMGTPIKASENGTVIYSGSELEEFGNLILLSHSGGWVTAYGNASSRMVKRGDTVKRGQVIAKSGKSGSATVPQLHFEIRKNSKPVNPLKHLSKG